MQLQIQQLRPYATIPTQQLPEVPDMIYMRLLKPLFLFQLGKLFAFLLESQLLQTVKMLLCSSWHAPDWLLNTASIWQTALGWLTATIGANCSFR